MAVYRPKYRDPATGKLKPSAIYWYEFVRDGKRHRGSTGVENKRVAQDIEAAEKTNLARGLVGIAEREPAPQLKVYAKTFERDIETLKSDRPATVTFYKEKLRRLLSYEPLASCRLDQIDEALIAKYSEMRRRSPFALWSPGRTRISESRTRYVAAPATSGQRHEGDPRNPQD
ncbi:MAG: hypothetical protein WDO18_09745 [Acidobacteriota bacterium]